uniref:Hyaluronidase n=1 Tax=Simulium guianense TaxID=445764 RepID=F5GTX2_SIMGU
MLKFILPTIYLLAIQLKHGRTFEVIWNVPTENCRNSTDFSALLKSANITYNAGDRFRGEKIQIFYSPGAWPSLEHGKVKNGGLPYKGNLSLHIDQFKQQIGELIDKDYSGYAIIDMESFRPVFRQNTGWMLVYRTETLKNVSQIYPELKEHELFQKAAQLFELPAEKFMLETLKTAKENWPKAKWGYYGYPYCFNSKLSNFECPKLVMVENNRTDWLFSAYDHMYPSVYIFKRNSEDQNRKLIAERVKEYQRIKQFSKNKRLAFYPYVWYYYNDPGQTGVYLSNSEFKMTMVELVKGNMDGTIIWGSSADFKKPEFCGSLYNYTKTVIIPSVEKARRMKKSK